MINRDFFRILIKIIGLYFFIQITFSVIPSQISLLGLDSDLSQKAETLFYVLIIVSLSVAILYYLIRFPDKIIDLFKLDKGFENNEISITNFNSANILKLSVLIIGGFLIIQNLTTVISLMFYEIKKNYNPILAGDGNNGIDLFLSALNLTLGCCLIIYRENLAKYFEK